MPERLPARFQPRPRRPALGARRPARRRLTVGAAVVLIAASALARQAAPSGMTAAAQLVRTATRPAPAASPAATPVPTTPAGAVPPPPAATARQPGDLPERLLPPARPVELPALSPSPLCPPPHLLCR